jgi:hypothetical protein
MQQACSPHALTLRNSAPPPEGMCGSAGVPTRPAGYTGDGSRADSGIPPAASRQLHSLTHTPSWVYRRRLTGRLWNTTSCLTAAPLTHSHAQLGIPETAHGPTLECHQLPYGRSTHSRTHPQGGRLLLLLLLVHGVLAQDGRRVEPHVRRGRRRHGRHAVRHLEVGSQYGPQSSTGISTGSFKFNRDFNRLLEIQQGFQQAR